MVTAGIVFWILNYFHITVNIRNVCVLLAPWFASNTALATFFLTKEVKNTSAGLVAAPLIAIVPGTLAFAPFPSLPCTDLVIFRLHLPFRRRFFR